jgi:hypothetical protein
MKGTLFSRPKQFFICISPRISVEWLINTTWYFLRMRYKQCKLCRRRPVMKGTLL